MKRLILVAIVLGYSLSSNRKEGFHIYQYPGYDNLDQIPSAKYTVHQKDRPQPPCVTPPDSGNDTGISAPSDATILFDGNSLEHFQESTWHIINGHLIAGKGDLSTKSSFGDCQLHVEWRTPNLPQGEPVDMGNSGILFMKRYELHVFDSYSCKIYADGLVGV
jgi:hypothetical protein